MEIDNPFASESEILEGMAPISEILSPYRIVVKVPHLGPLNKNNITALLEGNFPVRVYTKQRLPMLTASHDLAIMLRESMVIG